MKFTSRLNAGCRSSSRPGMSNAVYVRCWKHTAADSADGRGEYLTSGQLRGMYCPLEIPGELITDTATGAVIENKEDVHG